MPDDTRPNIVMVMVDDAPARLFDYLTETNTLVRDEGATVSNYLLSQPVCAPSRATILRGQYSHNTGIIANSFDGHSALWHFRYTGREDSTLATWFEDAGYRTALVGKYLNGYGETGVTPTWYTPPGWSYFFGVSGDAGNAYEYDAWDSVNGMEYYESDPLTDYLTNVISGKAVGFLQNAIAEEVRVPFLLIVTPKAPHHPATPHRDYEDYYDGVPYPKGNQNPSFDEVNVLDKPKWVKNQDRLGVGDITAIDHNYRQKLRSMESVDDLVEALIGAIGTEMSNTYFIFCSDNGFHAGEHRLGHQDANGGKNTSYEEDIRVPLYIRGPDIDEQSTVTELVGNVDIAPTLCDIADVTPDPNVILDGRSFLPLVKGQTVTWRDYYLLSRGTGHPYAGFRHADFMFMELDEDQGNDVAGEYYDLTVTGGEYELDNGYNNLLPPRLTELQERLDELRHCEGTSCRAAEEE